MKRLVEQRNSNHKYTAYIFSLFPLLFPEVEWSVISAYPPYFYRLEFSADSAIHMLFFNGHPKIAISALEFTWPSTSCSQNLELTIYTLNQKF